MSVPNQDIDMLWNLPEDEFNEWRRNNDIPLLFDYFVTKLPMFTEWLKEYSIDKQCFSKAPFTGEWFSDSKEKVYIEYLAHNENVIYITLYSETLVEYLRKSQRHHTALLKKILALLDLG